MPIYEFVCRNCRSRFETLVGSGSDQVVCPECGTTLLDKQISVPSPVARFERPRGGHTCCGRDERCERPPCEANGSCRRDWVGGESRGNRA